MTEAIDCCDHALEVDPENKAVIQEKERCQRKLDQLEEKKRKEEERQKKEEERKSKIDQMVKVNVHSRPYMQAVFILV